MADLQYVGPAPANPTDLVNDAYVANLPTENLTETQVQTQITAALAAVTPPLLTQTAYNAGVANNATKAFVDTGDAALLKIAQVGANSGVAGLTINGTVDPARLAVASAQEYPKLFTSPVAYFSTAQSATATATTLFPIAVADPGYPYVLYVSGLLEGQTGTDGTFPVVYIRQGSATGQIVAAGGGLGESYTAGVISAYTTPGNGVYQVPPWAYNIDTVVLGGGGGGNGSLYVQSFGGLGGSWSTNTYTKGASTGGLTFGPEVRTLLFTVGAGGAGGGAGGGSGINGSPSTISYPGMTTVSGAGGKGGGQVASFSANGKGVASQSYNGNTYPGSADQTTGGAAGNAYGGGGASGIFGQSTPGGNGASGAVYFFASPSAPTPVGPITITPTPLNAQTPITGATTLYAVLVSSGSASVTANPFDPGLMVIPIPAS